MIYGCCVRGHEVSWVREEDAEDRAERRLVIGCGDPCRFLPYSGHLSP